jgi:hypothetical protein
MCLFQATIAVALLAALVIAAVAISFHSGALYTSWLQGMDVMNRLNEHALAVESSCADSVLPC